MTALTTGAQKNDLTVYIIKMTHFRKWNDIKKKIKSFIQSSPVCFFLTTSGIQSWNRLSFHKLEKRHDQMLPLLFKLIFTFTESNHTQNLFVISITGILRKQKYHQDKGRNDKKANATYI